MIKAFIPRGRFGYWEKHFADAPALGDAFRPVHYVHCQDRGAVPGFIRTPVHTILIDLKQSEETLLKDCNESTRYEITRARRDGASFRVATDRATFMEMYASASRHKSLPPTSAEYLDSFGENLRITEAAIDGKTIVTHVYAADPSVSRVCLFYSASLFRDMDKGFRPIAGRANRFLHFQDMLHFRQEGWRWLDLGGYEPPGTETDTRAVSGFKESFGGQVVQEANYLSFAQHLYRRGRQSYLRVRSNLRPRWAS